MNWDALGTIAEITSSLFVLLTLIFLLRQVRQSSDALRLQSWGATYDEWNAMTGEIQNLPELRSAFRKDLKQEQLTGEERFILSIYFVRILHMNDKTYTNYRAGAIDDSNFENFRKILFVTLRSSSYFPSVWNAQRHRFSQPFQDLIDLGLNNVDAT